MKKADIEIETPFGLWMDIMTRKADGQQMFMEQKYRVKVDENAVEGDNEIEIRYTSSMFSGYVKLDPFTLDIQTDDAIISVESVKSTPEKLVPGGTGYLTIKLILN